ncbi:MAG: hypothetical protein ABIJ18_02800 [archaeon]
MNFYKRISKKFYVPTLVFLLVYLQFSMIALNYFPETLLTFLIWFVISGALGLLYLHLRLTSSKK